MQEKLRARSSPAKRWVGVFDQKGAENKKQEQEGWRAGEGRVHKSQEQVYTKGESSIEQALRYKCI